MRLSQESTLPQKNCAICGTNKHAKEYLCIYDRRTQGLQSKSIAILRCSACGLVYVNEPVRANRAFEVDGSRGDLRSQWREQFPDELDVYGPEAWGTQHQDVRDVIQWQYQAVAELLGDKLGVLGVTLVEIGAARGYLLAEIAKHHPQAHLIGVEPSPVMAQLAQKTGAEIINGIVEDASLAPKSIDAVVAFGSFIQIRAPLSTLRYLNVAMKPGGHVWLDSPNDDSLFRALARFLYHNPRLVANSGLAATFERFIHHVYHPGRFFYYTSKTYMRLLDMAGFKVVGIKMRQARYLTYGEARLSIPVKSAAQVISFAERLFNRQNWVEVSAVKTREV